jgi:hypothetical protein
VAVIERSLTASPITRSGYSSSAIDVDQEAQMDAIGKYQRRNQLVC